MGRQLQVQIGGGGTNFYVREDDVVRQEKNPPSQRRKTKLGGRQTRRVKQIPFGSKGASGVFWEGRWRATCDEGHPTGKWGRS